MTWFANRALGNSDEMTVGRCILKPVRTNGRHYRLNCCEILTNFMRTGRATAVTVSYEYRAA